MKTQTRPVNKIGIKSALLIISLSQMGALAISSVISDVLEVFPDVSDQTAQFLMTFPGIFILIASLLSAFLTRWISQKRLAVAGLTLNVVTAVGGTLVHGNIVVLFCWAVTLGMGLGLWMPIVNAIVSDHFHGNERAALLGRISSAQNVGAIFMTVAGGTLAMFAWHYVYLVYFIALPGLLCAVIFLPDEKTEAKKDRSEDTGRETRISLKGLGIDGSVILFSAIQFYFSLPYNAGPANFSLLLSERGAGGTQMAGILSGLYFFGGIISGWLFGTLEKRIHRFSIPLGFLLMGAGFLGLGAADSLPAYMLVTVLGGMSIPMVVSQSSLCVVENKRPEHFAMANAVLLAFGNLGAFFSPMTTSLSTVVTGSDSIETRMIFCAVMSAAGAVVTGMILRIRKKESPEKKEHQKGAVICTD